MKYIVMECHTSYAVLLDENGVFLKAANLHYEVGQTVSNPVLMQENQTSKDKTQKAIKNTLIAIAACLVLIFSTEYYQYATTPYSTILLSINPQIQMQLNKKGNVVEITGTNEDGKTLLNGYNAKGKSKTTVADELVEKAVEMGFLKDGGNVTFSIDTPDKDLYKKYENELKSSVKPDNENSININIIIKDKNEIDDNDDENDDNDNNDEDTDDDDTDNDGEDKNGNENEDDKDNDNDKDKDKDKDNDNDDDNGNGDKNNDDDDD